MLSSPAATVWSYICEPYSMVPCCSEEGVDPLFESSLYDCSPCIDLIGGQVRESL